MDPLTALAASGLRARMESLDMLGNNIANVETSGYKVDREFYNLFLSADAVDGYNDPAVMPVIEKNWTDYSQGVLRATGNPLDFAIEGRGFFAVDGPGGTLYTRNGGFHVSSAGLLVTQEGYTVRGADEKPLKLSSSAPVEALPDGTLRQAGQSIGKLAVLDFDDPHALAKSGDTYFQADPNATPHAAAATVQQGKLEGSNVGSAEAAVRLVGVMRQFEMLQRAIKIGGEMNRKAVEEVARVNS